MPEILTLWHVRGLTRTKFPGERAPSLAVHGCSNLGMEKNKLWEKVPAKTLMKRLFSFCSGVGVLFSN